MSGYTLKGKRVWVPGHQGMVGSAIVRRLAAEDCEIITAPRCELDLRDQIRTTAWVRERRPSAVFLAAARVGGILANATYPADFLYQNIMIEANTIEACHQAGVEKLLFLGSSCIYPRNAEQPIREDSLLTGALEPTNQWYAIAKITGIKLAQAYRQQYQRDFICAMPTNLYGPGDNFDLTTSHVLPAIMRKVHEAKLAGDRKVVMWGSGRPRREFLHVDDCADACVHLMKTYSEGMQVNVGSGEDLSILDLTHLIFAAVGFEGTIKHDLSKPDGTPRKLLDISKIKAIGWSPRIDLPAGIASTYAWFQKHSSVISNGMAPAAAKGTP